jgi:hypothetical protein
MNYKETYNLLVANGVDPYDVVVINSVQYYYDQLHISSDSDYEFICSLVKDIDLGIDYSHPAPDQVCAAIARYIAKNNITVLEDLSTHVSDIKKDIDLND